MSPSGPKIAAGHPVSWRPPRFLMDPRMGLANRIGSSLMVSSRMRNASEWTVVEEWGRGSIRKETERCRQPWRKWMRFPILVRLCLAGHLGTSDGIISQSGHLKAPPKAPQHVSVWGGWAGGIEAEDGASSPRAHRFHAPCPEGGAGRGIGWRLMQGVRSTLESRVCGPVLTRRGRTLWRLFAGGSWAR